MKNLPNVRPKLYSDASISIIKESIERVRKEYELYYHFDRVFICVDEKSLEVIDIEYD